MICDTCGTSIDNTFAVIEIPAHILTPPQFGSVEALHQVMHDPVEKRICVSCNNKGWAAFVKAIGMGAERQ